MSERARHIADSTPRHHGAECSDLRDFIGTVFLPDIVNHFIAFVVGDVHVNIRRRRTLGIEESFKRQFIFKRVDRGDKGKVRNKRTARRPPGGSHDFVLPPVTQKVGDHKKIRRVPFLFNDGEFVLNAFFNLGSFLKFAQSKTPIHLLAQFLVVAFSIFRLIRGENPCAEFEFKIALRGNFLRVRDSFRYILE